MENGRHKRFDVIIVGGGPSGLHTASLLADSGLNVALFDERSEIGEGVVCSGVISQEAFSRYDLSTESIVGKLKEAELFSPGGIQVPYSHPETAAVVVDRHIFDGKLGETAGKRGAEIYLNSKVSSLFVNDNFVEAHLKTQEGEKRVHATIAVIATGVSFVLQSALGLGRPKRIVKGIQIEVSASHTDRLRVYFGSRFSNGFFGWAIPLMNGKTRIGAMTRGNALEGLKNVLSEVGPHSDLCTDIGTIKRRGIAFGNIPRSYADRVIAVGEAAGHIKTTTGGGIYYGLISAEIACEVINKAFKKGNFERRTLSEYERLWRKSLGKEIKFGEYFHKFYSRLNDNSVDRLFHAAKQDGLLSFIADRGKFDWHREAVLKIIRSPNLRRVLWNGLISNFSGIGSS
ncbi:MAG TPA: NAD(P)/FAD-dependent oxidoreductase [Thermodesulfobacteriota bacterium]|nr:NAD(P)/FAD-dependent oxidoreductase [Thermodesulfobacteriota bacterium]